MEYTFLADQFVWLQEQKHPPKRKDDDNDDELDDTSGPLSPK